MGGDAVVTEDRTSTSNLAAIGVLMEINNELYAQMTSDPLNKNFDGLHVATKIISAEIQRRCQP